MKKHIENGVPFGQAIEALKKGKRVQRKGWNGKGLFIAMQVPSDIDVETIVPKMHSLPQSVKDVFAERFKNSNLDVKAEKVFSAEIFYRNQLIMIYPDNMIYGWVASPSDILEEDWLILD